MLPPSESSFPGGPVGGSDLFGIRDNSGSVQPALMLEDDLFVIGDDGTMNFDDVSVRKAHESSGGAKVTQSFGGKERERDIVGFDVVCVTIFQTRAVY